MSAADEWIGLVGAAAGARQVVRRLVVAVANDAGVGDEGPAQGWTRVN